LSGEVKGDEMYIVADHKGNPEIFKREGRRNRLRGAKGRGTLEKEKTPVLGLIQRGGEVVIKVLYNLKQDTINPVIQGTIAGGTLIYTNEYDIYGKLLEWGYNSMFKFFKRQVYNTLILLSK
jgi:transposase-like protein